MSGRAAGGYSTALCPPPEHDEARWHLVELHWLREAWEWTGEAWLAAGGRLRFTPEQAAIWRYVGPVVPQPRRAGARRR